MGGGTLVYNTDGTLQSTTGNQITFTPAGGASPLTLDLRFGTTIGFSAGRVLRDHADERKLIHQQTQLRRS